MRNNFPSLLAPFLGAVVCLWGGCQPDEVVEYTAPKETIPDVSGIQQQLQQAHGSFDVPHTHPAGEAHDHDHDYGTAPAALQLAIPAGWEEQPLTAMRQASFLVKGDAGAFVDISVMSFPGDTGGLYANINRWRDQVGLEPLAGEQIDAQLTRNAVNGNDYVIVDIPGAGRNGEDAQRIIGAIHPRGGQTWFFKMMGEDELTAAQREPFFELLQSVRYPE